eukprot:5187554-Alexandrium_andersonii.AAC.1
MLNAALKSESHPRLLKDSSLRTSGCQGPSLSARSRSVCRAERPSTGAAQFINTVGRWPRLGIATAAHMLHSGPWSQRRCRLSPPRATAAL